MTTLTVRHLAKKRRQLRGSSRTTPERAQAHLEMLLASGMTMPVVAEVAGTQTSTINRLRRDRQAISKDLEARLLRVRPRAELVVAGRLVHPVGAQRRIQGLMVMGWSQVQIAEHAGLINRQVSLILSSDRMLLKATHDAIDRAYRALSTSRGDSRRATALAKERGYHAPAAWDDDEIDLAYAQPSNPEVDPTTEAEHRLDEFERLIRSGLHIDRAVAALGITRNTLEKAAWRAGRKETGRLLSRKTEGAS